MKDIEQKQYQINFHGEILTFYKEIKDSQTKELQKIKEITDKITNLFK